MNYDQHLEELRSCDLLIEAIAERPDWKADLYRKITPYLNERAILATNTSGLPLSLLAESVPEAVRSRFCGIHFFNPPRYMALVELIPCQATDPAILDLLETFLVSSLGKGVIRAVDTAGKVQLTGRTLYLSPQGRPLDQDGVRQLAMEPRLILLAGRYEGIDERLIKAEVDEEWSIGDYVLSGGEPAALVLIDAVTRLLPGALNDQESAAQDSFMDGLLDCPHYTRPEEIDGCRVPAVLMSGDHAAIARWRRREALGRTWRRRPDLLARRPLSAVEQALLADFIREYQESTEDAGSAGVLPEQPGVECHE
jgi:tRNA (guanine37-N1)-methyltransferase